MDIFYLVLVLIAIGTSFLVSASVGLGGSLLLVPVLVLVLGPKEGVALAALLLGGNNMVKMVVYRRTIPWRASISVTLLLSLGAFVGASAMASAPERLVVATVLLSFFATLVVEKWQLRWSGRLFGPVLAFAAGATSGFSGTSGPLKGVAIRNLGLDRRHFVGAASVASLAGDLTKSAVYASAQLLDPTDLKLVALALPLMIAGTLCGSCLNRQVGERVFAWLFWGIMLGYSARLLHGLQV